MNTGCTIFSQLMALLPLPIFRKCVQRYQGERYVKHFSCLGPFWVMPFAQLTLRESLRDIEACWQAIRSKFYHRGIH